MLSNLLDIPQIYLNTHKPIQSHSNHFEINWNPFQSIRIHLIPLKSIQIHSNQWRSIEIQSDRFKSIWINLVNKSISYNPFQTMSIHWHPFNTVPNLPKVYSNLKHIQIRSNPFKFFKPEPMFSRVAKPAHSAHTFWELWGIGQTHSQRMLWLR